MKLTTILLAVLPVSAFALEQSFDLERRVDNTAKILADFKTLDTDFRNLNKTLNSFPDGGPIPPAAAAQFESEGEKIRTDFQTLANDLQTTTNVTKAEVTQIINAVVVFKNILGDVGKNIVAHKVAFDNAGLTPSIVQALQSYKGYVQMACTKLKSLAPSAQKMRLRKVCLQIQAILQNTIKGLQS